MKRKEKKKDIESTSQMGFRFSLVMKIASIAICPIVVLGVVLSIVCGRAIAGGMEQEVLSGLDSLVQTLEGAMDALDEGDYFVDGDALFKGKYNVTEHQDKLDEFVEGYDTEITLIYGKTRMATTLRDANGRMVGTEISQAVYDTVVEQGKKFSSNNVVIKEEQYYVVYHPMKNTNGEVVGCLFAGRPATQVNSYITSKMMHVIITSIVIAAISVVAVVICVLMIRKSLAMTGKVMDQLAEGDLTATVPEPLLRQNDELGDMGRGVNRLQKELARVLGRVNDAIKVLSNSGKELSSMASQTSNTADEIGHAVEDISKGAVSQAEEIENASSDIGQMASIIAKIVESVASLDGTSDLMKRAGDSSNAIIHDLSISNDKTMEAIERIGEQVHATNESANHISEAIQLITSIAEETNLLSLNASIEAARAGEQGKGFAVVANQIQKLAEQSNESAKKVGEIIDNLLKDSEKTVSVMDDVRKIVDEQHEKLTQTKREFTNVSNGIDASREETSEIKEQTNDCDSARVRVEDVIQNLSAISQENAAATQQTTASMQELNVTINLLAESAGDLTDLSDTLEKEIAFFKL